MSVNAGVNVVICFNDKPFTAALHLNLPPPPTKATKTQKEMDPRIANSRYALHTSPSCPVLVDSVSITPQQHVALFTFVPSETRCTVRFFSFQFRMKATAGAKPFFEKSDVKTQKGPLSGADYNDTFLPPDVLQFVLKLPPITSVMVGEGKEGSGGGDAAVVETARTVPAMTHLIIFTPRGNDYLLGVWQPGPGQRDELLSYYHSALFTLPNEGSPIMPVPNGEKRFCIDLCESRKSTAARRRRNLQPASQEEQNKDGTCFLKDSDFATSVWTQSRAVRAVLPQFRLTLDTLPFEDALQKAAMYHEKQNGSTWITQDWITAIAALNRSQRDKRLKDSRSHFHKLLQFHSFELWDVESGDLCALTLGFSYRAAYHDFTMCTLKRDDRSAGSVLSKLTGLVLEECGYDLWYWGNRLGYMADYEKNGYGGVDLERVAFYERWDALTAEPRQGPSRASLEDALAGGRTWVEDKMKKPPAVAATASSATSQKDEQEEEKKKKKEAQKQAKKDFKKGLLPHKHQQYRNTQQALAAAA